MIKVRPYRFGFAMFCQAARDASYFSGEGKS
jgi:hypothetical protein